jgi:hypothetical protein
MAIGDDATAAGYPLVPNTGEDGRVRYGAREINRTRDIIAAVKSLIPVGISGFQTASGISMGTTDPVNTDGKPDGVIYLKIL